MSAMACCPLSADDGEPVQMFDSARRRAAKEHRCCECRETIPVGATYEHAKGMWDGSWSTFKTCLSCAEIRDHFDCDGFIYEQLWPDLEENFFPTMSAGGPCMEGLSPAAKERLFARRLKWVEEGGVPQRPPAPPPPRPRPRDVLFNGDDDAG